MYVFYGWLEGVWFDVVRVWVWDGFMGILGGFSGYFRYIWVLVVLVIMVFL